MTLFQLGDFTLNSGAASKWKLECDALTDDDWKALAEMVYQMVGSFYLVEGVPRGGLKLAEHLKPFSSAVASHHLIVDDVLTTGGSMLKLKEAYTNQDSDGDFIGYSQPLKGAVIFARGQCPTWIKALFQCHESLWLKKELQR